MTYQYLPRQQNAFPIWAPSVVRQKNSVMEKFRQHVVSIASPPPIEMHDLYQWSVKEREAFWKTLLAFLKIPVEGNIEPVCKEAPRFQDCAWFPQLRLNFAECFLSHKSGTSAITYWGEDSQRKEWSFADLNHHVTHLAHTLKTLGVTSSCSVAACLPNIPEAVAAYLATAALGATWCANPADFPVELLVDRLAPLKPKVLVCTDGYQRDGKQHSCLDTVVKVCRSIPSIETIVFIPTLHGGGLLPPDMPRVMPYSKIFQEHVAQFKFERFPFDHPLCVAFTSGTTGIPKSLVHRAGGVLLEHLKELALHSDVQQADKLFFHASFGSTMWYWQVSALALGASIVLYDGAEYMHEGRILLELAEKERVTLFGAHPRYYAQVEKLDIRPEKEFKLEALHTLLATGGPLHPEQYDYMYKHWSNKVWVCALASCTDILGCFALGSPLSPVYRGEVQGRSLGMNVQVWNEEGHQVRAEQGELVCTKPFPSQPLSLLGDAKGVQYFKEYFSYYAERNVWRQGDFAELTPSQGIILYGRSESTITSDGIRIGTAEFYRVVENQPEVKEALVISLPREDSPRPKIILFVSLKKGQTMTEALRRRLETCLHNGVTTSHVPDKIFAVSDIPHSYGGKLVEGLVRDVFLGKKVDERFLGNAQYLIGIRKVISEA